MRAKSEEEQEEEGKYCWKIVMGIRNSRFVLENGHGYSITPLPKDIIL